MRILYTTLLVLALAMMWTVLDTPTRAYDDDDDEYNVELLDNCDPTSGWGGPGCLQKKGENDDVTPADFDALLVSPLSVSVVGHPSWRNDPSYLSILKGESVRVRNRGGRPHTFTKVANFGGGVVPPLNVGLGMAPECAALTNIAPGEKAKVTGLAPGLHKFQCCFHPWMRAAIKVK